MTGLSDTAREKLAHVSTATLTTQLLKRGLRNQCLQGVSRLTAHDRNMVGEAFGPSAPTSLIKHHAVAELNTPIACGGVAVYPDDVLVGDAEGLVVLPAHLAEEIAEQSFEQEKMEVFLREEIASGKPLRGTYPPDEATKARYVEWQKKQDAEA